METMIDSVNWLAVVVITIFSFVLGGLWHSQLMFGKAWKKELNYGAEGSPKVNFALTFGLSALLHFVAVLVLAMHIGSGSTAASGMLTGLILGAGLVSPAIAVTYIFAMRSLRLFLIDAGLYVVFFTVAGLILGAWKG